jgi:alkylation response protein AidB-like acyl-CoA dehydrogenase
MSVLDRNDLDFLLFGWLKAEDLTSRARFDGQSRQDYTAFLDLGERLAEGPFLACYKSADRDEPRFSDNGEVVVQPDLADAVRRYLAAGLQLASVEEEHGGMQFPVLVSTAMTAMIMAANVAASGFLMLSAANARLIRDHGTPRQIELFATPQHDGAALGTMCLSEPDTGSSLGDITTRAIPDSVDTDGADTAGERYRLFGRKMWISAADHDVTGDITHLVLAKIANPDGTLPAGSKGISLFIVPKILPEGRECQRNDVAVIGLNHKMGYRGTPNCAVNFGEGRHQPGGRPGAVGYLLGAPGQGLAIMFQMMNEARINVGLSGAALAYRGYLLSRDYARQRLQGRPLTDKKALRPVPIIRHPDIRRMVLAQKAIAEGALALCLYSAGLVDVIATAPEQAERERAQRLLDILTPVTKSWPSEQGPIANSLAIQVHGGYGYTRDFDVEQLYRDNRLNPIHEGTTGIQALDLLGRKILSDGGSNFEVLLNAIRDTETRAAHSPSLTPMADRLATARQWIEAAVNRAVAGNDVPDALAHATAFLSAFGHLVVGWLWLDMTEAAHRLDAPQAEAKLWTCRYFYDVEVPLIPGLLAPMTSGSAVTVEIPEHLL